MPGASVGCSVRRATGYPRRWDPALALGVTGGPGRPEEVGEGTVQFFQPGIYREFAQHLFEGSNQFSRRPLPRSIVTGAES